MKAPARLQEKIVLASYLSYRIGGPADYFLEAHDESEVEVALMWAAAKKIPVTLLGNGSNVLVRDGGIEGLVLFLGRCESVNPNILEDNVGSVLLRVPSWASKARLLKYALEAGYSGLEFSAGIPGSLGGAVYMNAGTKWGSYGDVIERVRLFSLEKGFFEKTKEEMGFRYRGHGEGLLDGKTVVVSADLRLQKNASPTEVRSQIDDILTQRGQKQPLEFPNCGSVFKNPPTGPGAGRLIEACDLKGAKIGDAQVSLKHANFILNLGHASARDVEALIQKIRTTVKAQKNVELEAEVIILGRP